MPLTERDRDRIENTVGLALKAGATNQEVLAGVAHAIEVCRADEHDDMRDLQEGDS